MMNRYFVFRKMMDFVADYVEVTNAEMSNWAKEIEITGVDEDGSTITIKVELKEGETDGNQELE